MSLVFYTGFDCFHRHGLRLIRIPAGILRHLWVSTKYIKTEPWHPLLDAFLIGVFLFSVQLFRSFFIIFTTSLDFLAKETEKTRSLSVIIAS
jgi:hypothetical protein